LGRAGWWSTCWCSGTRCSLGVAPAQLRAAGAAVNPEDVARLSPPGYDHSNLLGRYTFALAEPLARGALRPLRDPTVPDAVAQ